MASIRRTLALTAVLWLCQAANAEAQTIGFKLGPSFSTASVDDAVGTISTLTRFTGGGFIRFAAGPLTLQPEVMYVTKGAKQGLTGLSLTAELDYIEIPVLLLLPLRRGAGATPYVYAGPAFAFEIGCNLTFENGGTETVDCDTDDDSFEGFARKSLDVGAMFGGGISIPTGPGAVLLEGRYNFGLTNILDESGETYRNRSGAVLIGYSIPIGR